MPVEPKPQMLFRPGAGSPVGRITLAGLLRDHPGMPEKPTRTLGSFAVFYLLRGTGTLRDATGVRCQLVPGDLVTVFPDIPHWYGPPPGQVWDEFYLVFSGKVFDLWRAEGLLNPARPVRHLEPLDYWLRRLQEVVTAEAAPLQQVCSLQHLLAEAFAASATATEPEWLNRARGLLGEPVKVSPEQVARTLGMSYANFRKRFAAATGTSPNHYRLTKLIDRACGMIVAGAPRNKEIAEALGFCDEFEFSHRFKKVVGVSPMDFRHRLPRPAAKPGRRPRRHLH